MSKKTKRSNLSKPAGKSQGWLAVVVTAILFAAVILAAVAFWPVTEDLEPRIAIEAARAALSQGRFAEAERLAESVPVEDAFYSQSRLIAGEASTRASEFSERAVTGKKQSRPITKS
jgi:hypothetical protein